jgi:primosomal protein N'
MMVLRVASALVWRVSEADLAVIDQLFQDIKQGTILFLGLVCLLTFAANAGVLAWILSKRSSHALVRCPKCGRTVHCPHCADDEDLLDEDEVEES